MYTYIITPKGKKALDMMKEFSSENVQKALELTKDGNLTVIELQHILGVDYVTARDVLTILEAHSYIRRSS